MYQPRLSCWSTYQWQHFNCDPYTYFFSIRFHIHVFYFTRRCLNASRSRISLISPYACITEYNSIHFSFRHALGITANERRYITDGLSIFSLRFALKATSQCQLSVSQAVHLSCISIQIPSTSRTRVPAGVPTGLGIDPVFTTLSLDQAAWRQT